jgi:hypothetical protein
MSTGLTVDEASELFDLGARAAIEARPREAPPIGEAAADAWLAGYDAAALFPGGAR